MCVTRDTRCAEGQHRTCDGRSWGTRPEDCSSCVCDCHRAPLLIDIAEMPGFNLEASARGVRAVSEKEGALASEPQGDVPASRSVCGRESRADPMAVPGLWKRSIRVALGTGAHGQHTMGRNLPLGEDGRMSEPLRTHEDRSAQ